MDEGHFVERKHKGFCAVLYYFAVRQSEALKALKKQFTIDEAVGELHFDVGQRLKHSKKTPALTIRLDVPYVNEVIWTVRNTIDGDRVFPYCRKTAYNIVSRVFPAYPHFFRLSRITRMFEDGWTVSEVRNWTGLTLNALNYYIGLANIRRRGRTIR